jgi:hypothetical protein
MTCTTVTTLQAAADWAEACMWLRMFTVAGAHPALPRRLDTSVAWLLLGQRVN